MAALIRVLVIDDHPVVARGTAALLNEQADVSVVAVATSVAEGLAHAQALRPDVILCDIMFGSAPGGFDLLAANLGVPVILVSGFDPPAYYQTALSRGAAGYVLKRQPIEDLLRAVRSVAAGGTAFSRAGLASAHTAARPPSARECQVVSLVASGRSNSEIAAALGIEDNTVETHLRRMFTRYGLLSRTELAMRALREGWIEPIA